MKRVLALLSFLCWHICLIHLPLLALFDKSSCFAEEEASDEDSESWEDDTDWYFYLNHDDAGPIVEYYAPNDEVTEKDKELLTFLTPKVKGLRIVEFYAHWCPHCQHFRDHYVEFGKEMKTLAKQYFPKAEVNMFAVSCVPWKPVCNDFNISGYPVVIIFEDGASNGTEIPAYDLHPFKLLSKLGDIDTVDASTYLQDEENRKQKKKIKKTNDDFDQQGQRHFLPRTQRDIYNDAHLSFDFAMRHAVFYKNGTLLEKDFTPFAFFVEQLKDALPPTWKLKRLVSEIFDNIDIVKRSEKKLIETLDRYPPKKKSWSLSCTRGDKYAGYTCGLWELFHIMTIGIVEWNTFAGEDDWAYYRPEAASLILRNYIEHFFGCEVCRVNFLHAYDTCEYDRCNRMGEYLGELDDWKELPLWLFELHNGVNKRLLRERAEREHRAVTKKDEISVQWPSREDCPICWHSDGRWDPDNVYMFLRLTYW